MPHPIDATLLIIVTILCFVQIPIDFRVHRLYRTATICASLAIAGALLVGTISEQSLTRSAAALLVAIVVTTGYFLLHLWSPQSLGLGDVLLVAPLTLAVAYLSVDLVLTWHFIATFTGAIHAVVVRVRKRGNMIPYGPHLLGAAWLVMVFSV